MSHHWLLITFWFGPVSLQYINTEDLGGEPILESPQSSIPFSIPFINYLNPPQDNDFDLQKDMLNDNFNQFYGRTAERKRRTVGQPKESIKDSHWYPKLVDDKTSSGKSEESITGPVFAAYRSGIDENMTNLITLEPVYKKNFSPWGGKRDDLKLEGRWTWKRSYNIREPSMPKRVRFSPWGGKRSGQMVFKPGAKGSKVIYASTLPELTRLVSSFSPSGHTLDWAGVQIVPNPRNKRYPIKVLALTAPLDGKVFRDALPFKAFLDQLPKMYKPGHPYFDVNLKKDGKRKVKFSAWGGKRSPPIIGPIWTPTPQNVKDSTLDNILLLRNQETGDLIKAF